MGIILYLSHRVTVRIKSSYLKRYRRLVHKKHYMAFLKIFANKMNKYDTLDIMLGILEIFTVWELKQMNVQILTVRI